MATQDTTYLPAWMAAMRSSTRGQVIYDMLNSLEDSGVAASARLAMPNQPTTANALAAAFLRG